MPNVPDIALVAGAVVLAVLFVVVIRARHKGHAAEASENADAYVCDHLRPALDLLLSRGHTVRRVGQKTPDLPLEIHLLPPFDPKSVLEELKLEPPVYLSERNVLYCKEDWCEIHPKG
jgi:hypothetical protein